jgi:DNA-binding CsgD family transcriptional regulator
VNSTMTQCGLILLDESLNVVATNREAVQILAFPERPDRITNLNGWLFDRVRCCLVDKSPLSSRRFVSEFRSEKRTYLCRAFPLCGNPMSVSALRLALLLERKLNKATSVAEIAQRFGLTPREQETVRLLVEGLSSKEIAVRMNVSPNTVKAFIHLVMVKFNVSTRAGIIGKMVGTEGLDHPSNGGARPNFVARRI